MFVLMIANYYKLTSTKRSVTFGVGSFYAYHRARVTLGAIILRDLIPLFLIIFLLSNIVLKLASKIAFHIVSHCG